MTNEEEIENITKKMETAKAISLVSNIHKLTPPQKEEENIMGQVAIIESLRSAPRLKNLYLELMGLLYDEESRKLVQVASPIMNQDGAFRLVFALKRIAEEIEWSNFTEDELGPRIYEHYKQIYPYFTFWNDEYNLNPRDFTFVSTAIITFIDSSFHKAKNAKLLNVPGRVYSEDFLGKTLGNMEAQKKQREGVLQALNPFKKR